jgi:hypothetical protein
LAQRWLFYTKAARKTIKLVKRIPRKHAGMQAKDELALKTKKAGAICTSFSFSGKSL